MRRVLQSPGDDGTPALAVNRPVLIQVMGNRAGMAEYGRPEKGIHAMIPRSPPGRPLPEPGHPSPDSPDAVPDETPEEYPADTGAGFSEPAETETPDNETPD
jgi:hypothetical protein